MKNPYPIINIPHPTLKQTSSTIETINDDIRTQAARMIETMKQANGIGLAANQVNIANRLFVMGLPDQCWEYGDTNKDGIRTIQASYRSGEAEEEATTLRIFINPEIIWESEERSTYPEGCLSIPQQYADIIRPAQVRVKFQDENGETIEELFEGLDSHCVQHEIDHLNGVLFIDYLSSLKRNMIIKKVKKLTKASLL